MKRSDMNKRLKTAGPASNSRQPTKGGSNAGSCSRKLTTAGTTNPFENLVILEHLFKFCPVEVLKQCRLVCKLWFQESRLTWRNKCQIVMTRDMNRSDRLVSINHERIENDFGWKSASHLRMHWLLTYCRNPKNQCATKPYRSIKLMSSPKYRQCNIHAYEFPKLWDALGHNLTTVHLANCVFNSMDDFRAMLFKACPNLQTLKLGEILIAFENNEKRRTFLADKRMMNYKEPIYGRKLQLKTLKISTCSRYQLGYLMPWLEVFSHFQQLSHFQFCNSNSKWNGDDSFKEEFTELLEAMKCVRKHNPKALPLESVEITPALDISRCDHIAIKETELVKNLNIPMKSMFIKVQPGIDEENVKTILRSHAETVRMVKVTGNPHGPALNQEFPFGIQLNNLTSLKINKQLTKSLAFLKCTPNLKKLTVSGGADTMKLSVFNNREDGMDNMRMTHMEALRLDSIVTDLELDWLFRRMPHLITLHGLALSDQQFGIVCQNWTQLRSFSVAGNQLTDMGVIGMRNKRKRKKMTSVSPNIANLQELEEFAFADNRLTEECVFHGFLKLPRLEDLKCRNKSNLNWGPHVWIIIKDKNISLHETPCGHCPGLCKIDSHMDEIIF